MNNLSIQTISFLIGCGLLIVAIVGKEIVYKDFRFPELTAVARGLLGILGAILMAGSVGLLNDLLQQFRARAERARQLPKQSAPPPAAREPAEAGTGTGDAIANRERAESPSDPVIANASNGTAASMPPAPVLAKEDAPRIKRISLSDRLGPGQQYERIRVLINDQEKVIFSLDSNERSRAYQLTVSPGDRYSLIGSEASMRDGKIVVNSIRGRGVFNDNDFLKYRIKAKALNGKEITAEIVPE